MDATFEHLEMIPCPHGITDPSLIAMLASSPGGQARPPDALVYRGWTAEEYRRIAAEARSRHCYADAAASEAIANMMESR